MRYFLIVLSFLFLTAEAPSPWSIDELVGKKAPEFTLKDMNDKAVSLSSLKGNVVLISFWATWCPPCRDEMPSLNKLYREYRNRGLVVVAVSTDRSRSSVKDFLGKNPVGFPVLMDSDSKVARQFKVFSLPTTFLLDRNGAIVQKYLGEEEWDSAKIRDKITTLLGSQ
ncbi:MAG: TlpA family protein disulfide reductase [Nitrospirae bacterium]|nr:TlpA family protein disulfide reductase [Nitrospirota bacterium]MCL5421086.1 TlpA family protein disulfide reductase [Nitrospirota bacterium]